MSDPTWRTRGCGPDCIPGSHDPLAHETWGIMEGRRLREKPVVRTGPLVVDLVGARATLGGTEIHLSGKEWSVLAYLAERLDAYCSNDDIVQSVWGSYGLRTSMQKRGDQKHAIIAGYQSLSVVLNRLRGKFGSSAGLIETATGMQRGGRRLRLEPIAWPTASEPLS